MAPDLDCPHVVINGNLFISSSNLKSSLNDLWELFKPKSTTVPSYDHFTAHLRDNLTIAPLPDLKKQNWSVWKSAIFNLADATSTSWVFHL